MLCSFLSTKYKLHFCRTDDQSNTIHCSWLKTILISFPRALNKIPACPFRSFNFKSRPHDNWRSSSLSQFVWRVWLYKTSFRSERNSCKSVVGLQVVVWGDVNQWWFHSWSFFADPEVHIYSVIINSVIFYFWQWICYQSKHCIMYTSELQLLEVVERMAGYRSYLIYNIIITRTLSAV